MTSHQADESLETRQNPGAQEPFIDGDISQIPPIDNIHAETPTIDTGASILSQDGIPNQANLQQNSVYHALPVATIPDVQTPSSNGAIPDATLSNVPTPSNATPTPAVPKDGKSAAQPEFSPPLPSQAQANGAPVRQYLNENLSPYLLEVTKHVAAHRPQRPLEFIAEYFMEKSRQLEGTQ